jgi:DNA sulfur modification protein DndB
MAGRFVINDGQHRRAAIEMALHESPELGNETIAVVLFEDRGLERSQQMFADLNKYAVRPSTSLGILYDHRDPIGGLSKKLAFDSDAFAGVVELEKATLSLRSRKLFTLSSIYSANKALLKGLEEEPIEDLYTHADKFWSLVSRQFPEWKQVQENRLSASQVRQDFIHTHGVILQAIGQVGNHLLRKQLDVKQYVPKLSDIDWRRANKRLWEGRAMHNGRLSKSSTSITLAANAIKQAVDLQLNSEEALVEQQLESSPGRGE